MMSQLGVLLQETALCEDDRDGIIENGNYSRSGNTILGLLRERLEVRRPSSSSSTNTRSSGNNPIIMAAEAQQTKQRFFRFKGLGCCGATLFRPAASNVDIDSSEEEEEEAEEDNREVALRVLEAVNDDDDRVAGAAPMLTPGRAAAGMNLAAALAAERELRVGMNMASPARVSLMRLLEETASMEEKDDGDDSKKKKKMEEEEEEEKEKDRVCCVCMGREKGAALIPCGHTFCRVCSRELWLNRGSCPLCNRSIIDILHIF